MLNKIKEELFSPEVMMIIGKDGHKTSDGNLTLEYNYYTGEYFIEHNGYVRGDFHVIDTSFDACVDKFLNIVREKNIDIIVSYYEEEKGLEVNTDELEGLSCFDIVKLLEDKIEKKLEYTHRYNKLFGDICALIEDAKSKGIDFDIEDLDGGCHGEGDCSGCLDCELNFDEADEEAEQDEGDIGEKETFSKGCRTVACRVGKDKELADRLTNEGVWVHSFIRDLKTGELLWSKTRGEFVARYNEDGDLRCFIDDTPEYSRSGGDVGIDYEYVIRPLNMCVTRGSYGKDGKGPLVTKFIGELDKEHIKAILENQDLMPAFRELFESTLEEKGG